MATKARIRRQAPPLRSSTYDQRNEEERRGAGIRKGSPSSEVRGSGVRILSVDRGRSKRGLLIFAELTFVICCCVTELSARSTSSSLQGIKAQEWHCVPSTGAQGNQECDFEYRI